MDIPSRPPSSMSNLLEVLVTGCVLRVCVLFRGAAAPGIPGSLPCEMFKLTFAKVNLNFGLISGHLVFSGSL